MKNLERSFLKTCVLIRRFEEKLCELYPADHIKSPVHLSIGQEAVSTGVCLAMQKEDMISNTYRSHGSYIAKGGCLKQMMAELYGKRDGCAAGKAGSMHLFHKESGVLPTSAVVGTTIPMAAGFALAIQKKKTKQVVVAMFGDGSTEEGCFFETINFAKLHKLPIVFVCENNKLAIHNPLERRWACGGNICGRVEAYGIPTQKITNGDVMEIYTKTKEAIEVARNGQGPVFLEIFTYRYKEHVGHMQDMHEQYRDSQEYEFWLERDPINVLGAKLGNETLLEIEAEVKQEIDAAVEFAEKSTFPNTQEELMSCVYSGL